MAFMVARNAVIALYQGAAETSPRAWAIVLFLQTPVIPRRESGSTNA
jgi:hypothetical protein